MVVHFPTSAGQQGWKGTPREAPLSVAWLCPPHPDLGEPQRRSAKGGSVGDSSARAGKDPGMRCRLIAPGKAEGIYYTLAAVEAAAESARPKAPSPQSPRYPWATGSRSAFRCFTAADRPPHRRRAEAGDWSAGCSHACPRVRPGRHCLACVPFRFTSFIKHLDHGRHECRDGAPLLGRVAVIIAAFALLVAALAEPAGRNRVGWTLPGCEHAAERASRPVRPGSAHGHRWQGGATAGLVTP